MVTLNEILLLQVPNPFAARRVTEADGLGEGGMGEACVALQQTKDLQVNSVQRFCLCIGHNELISTIFLFRWPIIL